MTKTLMEVWQSSKYFHSFNVLPGKVKKKLSINESSYDPKMMKLQRSTSGKKVLKNFGIPIVLFLKEKLKE